MECRVKNDLRDHEIHCETAEDRWRSLCPAMRDTAVEIAAGIMFDGRRHRLYLSAFEDGWLNVSEERAYQLMHCLASFRGYRETDTSTEAGLKEVAEAALNAAIRSLYGENENTSSLCDDGFNEADFINTLINKRK